MRKLLATILARLRVHPMCSAKGNALLARWKCETRKVWATTPAGLRVPQLVWSVLILCFVVGGATAPLVFGTDSNTDGPQPFLYLPIDVAWWDAMSAMMDHQCPLSAGSKKDGILWTYVDKATAYNPLAGHKLCADNSNPTQFSESFCTSLFAPGYEFRTADGMWAWYDGHEGYDWSVESRTSVYAAANGVVECIGWAGSGDCKAYSTCYGYIVVVAHANGYKTLYAHLTPDSENPDHLPGWPNVTPYDKIALSGNSVGTGYVSTGSHLHFSVLHNGKYTDPFGWEEWGWPMQDPLGSCPWGEASHRLWVDDWPHRPGQTAEMHASVPPSLRYVGGGIAPPDPSPVDLAIFISDVTIPDGTVLYPNQSVVKTWRMRNSGSSTWGSGYELAFVGGDQMGAPSAVSVPTTAPGSTADISVSMTAPSGSGNYQGNWRMRNAQGVFFGDTVWVKITLQGSPPPGPEVPSADGIQVLGVDYPRAVTPGQTFRPSVRINLLNGELRESRGDMLRHKSGDRFGAWPHVSVVGTVYGGQEYTFTFYADDPMRAPDGEGTYGSVWQIWANGGWVGPEIHITFTVQQPQDLNQPPNRPSPTNEDGGANDWHYSRDGSQVRLCARHNGDPDGDAIVAYQFDVQGANTWNSGEVSTSCVTTSGLGPYGYEWRVRAKDNRGAWSDWSDPPWHFNIAEQQLSLDDFRFEPGSPSAAERVRVWTCLHGFGEVNIGLKIEANTATDGSASGDWYWIHHLGTFCYPQDDTSQWPNWETLPLEDGTHLIRATGFGPHGETIVKEANYTLLRRKPPPVQALFPIQEVKINSRTVTFRWNPAVRASEHQLLVSTENDPAQNSLLDVTLGGSAASYTHTFSQDHPRLRWRVIARNELGESEATNEFGIDRTAPSSAVSPLPATTHETKFTVSWSGNDNLAGLRWYDVQVRDSERGEWTDWQTGVDSTAAIFSGHPGHTYCFRARALDNAGNLESYPEGDGDTCTQVDPGTAPPTS